MASVDLSDPQLLEVYNKVRDSAASENWLLLGYGDTRNKLSVYASGSGGVAELQSRLQGPVAFGYVQVGDDFVILVFVDPSSASSLQKAKASVHKRSVAALFTHHHAIFSTESKDEVTVDKLTEAIKNSDLPRPEGDAKPTTAPTSTPAPAPAPASSKREEPVVVKHEEPVVKHEEPVAVKHEEPIAVKHEEPAAVKHEEPAAAKHEEPEEPKYASVPKQETSAPSTPSTSENGEEFDLDAYRANRRLQREKERALKNQNSASKSSENLSDVADQPKKEEPQKKEEAKQEEPKREEPKKEEPRREEPKREEPKVAPAPAPSSSSKPVNDDDIDLENMTEEELAALMEDLGVDDTSKVVKADPRLVTMGAVVNHDPVVKDEQKREQTELIEKYIHQLETNDPLLVRINLNNSEYFTEEQQVRLGHALAKTEHVIEFAAANAIIKEVGGVAIARGLAGNRSINIVNLESNSIGAPGMEALADALLVNTNLKELLINNQRTSIPTKSENKMAKAIEKNTTLQKLGYQCRDIAARNAIDKLIFRNKDLARQARVAASKKK